MREEYEQLELDTRKQLDKALEVVTTDAVKIAGEMIQRHCESMAQSDTAPGSVRNRHEAYGIAAEQLAKISRAVKAIKDDTGTLLGRSPTRTSLRSRPQARSATARWRQRPS